MALVYSYIRMSTKKQLEGDSLRRQVENESWILRNGHTLSDIKLVDTKSGYHGRHLSSHSGKLRLFLEKIEHGDIKPGDILLVEALDRLSRQEYEIAGEVFKQILNAGVHIACLKPFETIYTKESVSRDPMALMMPLMAFHLAHLESKNKANRLRKVWDHKREDAEQARKGGKPFQFDRRRGTWLDWDKATKQFVPNKWQHAVKYIFEQTAEGIGQRKVLGGLVEKFPGRKWNSSFIQAVLCDRGVIGERQPQTTDEKGNRVSVGNPIPNYYPAIISEELFTRAQAAKANNKKHKGPNSNYVNVFTGLLFNAHDGCAAHIQTTRSPRLKEEYVQRRLVSYNHHCKIPGSDPVSVKYPDFEAMILSHLEEIKPEDLNSKTGTSELRAKEQELAGTSKRLERIEQDMAEADADEYQTLRNAAKIARTKQTQLKADIKKMNEEMSADRRLLHAHDVIKALNTGDREQRYTLRLRLRSLLSEIIDSIYIKPEKHFGRVYTLCQINYRCGLVRQLGFGPGWVTSGSKATECPNYGIDLRDKAACKKPRLKGIAQLTAKPANKPDTTTIPDTVSEAAELFLRKRRSEMKPESFRVVPSKVRRFVEFIGKNTDTKEINQKDWALFIRTLKAEVSEGKLQQKTAEVTHNRCREFLTWLVEEKKSPELDFGGSAVKAMKS